MTCREKLKMEHPEDVDNRYFGGCSGCPEDYGYFPDSDECDHRSNYDYAKCSSCWNREIPNSEPEPNSQLDIHALIDEAMQKRDRSVAIYIHPENGMSVNVYPWPDVDDLWKLYEDDRITANDFRAKMNLPMVKNAEKFMRRNPKAVGGERKRNCEE